MSHVAHHAGEKGTTRLLAHLDLVSRLAFDEARPAAQRLEQELGPDLTWTLVFALANSRRRPFDAAAA